jgi:hypothetical protein
MNYNELLPTTMGQIDKGREIDRDKGSDGGEYFSFILRGEGL